MYHMPFGASPQATLLFAVLLNDRISNVETNRQTAVLRSRPLSVLPACLVPTAVRRSIVSSPLIFLRAVVDGAYFGTTFPHLFFMTYKSLVPDPPEKAFVPRVFGFRVHPRNLSGGGAPARGQGEQHEQRLQERRRLRRPHPPQTPPQQPSGAAEAAARHVGTGASAGAAAAAVVEVCAGSSPANGARAASGAGAGGKGRAEGGSVVVRIKEEEENWTKRRGGGADKTGAGGEVGSAAAAAAGEASGQQDVNGKKVDGGDSEPRVGGASHEVRSAENGRQAW